MIHVAALDTHAKTCASVVLNIPLLHIASDSVIIENRANPPVIFVIDYRTKHIGKWADRVQENNIQQSQDSTV